jgi:hypothetical protein
MSAHHHTLDNGARVVPCSAPLSSEDESGAFYVFAPEGGEGDGNDVKMFAARKAEATDDCDFVRA